MEILPAFLLPNSKYSTKNCNKKRTKTRTCFQTLLAIIFALCATASSAATYYIAPNGSDAANGDLTHPFATLNKAWQGISSGDIIYLRGGNYVFTSQQRLTGKNGSAGNLIKVWAYPGELPVLTRGGTGSAFSYSGNNAGIDFSGNYVHFKGLEVKGFFQINTYVFFGFFADNSNNCIFETLNVHDNGCGMGLNHNSNGNLVLNCDFHHNVDPASTIPYDNADGLDIAYVPAGNINTIRGCRSWWNCDDGFDTWNNDGQVIFENCWAFWNGFMPGTYTNAGNGNGFKLGGTSSDLGSTVLRTITNCLSFKNQARGIDQNLARCGMKIFNNTSYQNGARSFDIFSGTAISIIRNNIAYGDANIPIFTTASIADHNTFLLNGSVNSAYNVTNADFVSVASAGSDGARQADGSLPVLGFLHLSSGSDLINSGVNVGMPYTGTVPDIGAFEFTASSENTAPSIQNQTFSINEHSPDGTFTGKVLASDPNAGQVLTYSIISGNTNNAFAINGANGNISIADSAKVNYEVLKTFALTVSVQDNGTGNLKNQANATLNVMNVNEVPIINNQDFNVTQQAANGILVGTVVATDRDQGQTKSFSIISGNESGVFKINASSGNLTIDNAAAVDDETLPTYALIVKVQDNGTGNLSDQATISVTFEPSTLSVKDIPDTKTNGMLVYPNPVTNGILNVKLDEGNQERFELIILDLAGKVVIKKQYERENPVSINLSAYPPAIYLVQILSADFRSTQKFIIR